MNWQWDPRIALHVKDRISSEDAARQERTAQEVLRRFARQPGVVLADEVGMGKTFVALAVAASTALARVRDARPVVVLAPPGLVDKWQHDFELFGAACLPSDAAANLRLACPSSPEEFYSLFDAPPERRRQLVLLSYRLLSRELKCPWMEAAAVWRALRGRRDGGVLRARTARWASQLLAIDGCDLTRERWLELLSTSPRHWHHVRGHRYPPPPTVLLDALDGIDPRALDEVRAGLEQIPIRSSVRFAQRLTDARVRITAASKAVWALCLRRVRLDLPLLILDEAHHVRNASTKLASLLLSDEDRADAGALRGPLSGAFERMLFLTATPFQLGHGDLCNVLEHFANVAWDSPRSAPGGRALYLAALSELRRDLDCAQSCALALDRAWGRVRSDDLRSGDRLHENAETWWGEAAAMCGDGLPPRAQAAVTAYNSARGALSAAESGLRPWVIRHSRSPCFPRGKVPRRERLPGAAIEVEEPEDTDRGIQLERAATLPFLLAARAVTECRETRALFAEGLASSYEAFLHTSREADALDEDEGTGGSVEDERLRRRMSHIERALLDAAHPPRHPKVFATVDRAVRLWAQGHKVVVFCHWRATGAVLTEAISHAMDEWVARCASDRLGLPRSTAKRGLERLGDRLSGDSPLRRACDSAATVVLRRHARNPDCEDQWRAVVRRYLRTPTFLARFALGDGSGTPEDQLRTRIRDRRTSLGRLLDVFAEFLCQRCTPGERYRLLGDLGRLSTGRIDRARTLGAREADGRQRVSVLPDVRLINGSTDGPERVRAMAAFNTPFLPGVLVASAVLAEGVDLHLMCRHVIHHDLAWNPSTLEQRTGRVDRILCLAEREQRPIQVWLPYIEGTQDEKMYRVVRDREQWFRILMGEESLAGLSACDADRLAERVPLPAAVAVSLAMDLSLTE